MMAAEGKEILDRRFKALKINSNSTLLHDLATHYKIDNVMDFLRSRCHEEDRYENAYARDVLTNAKKLLPAN